METKIKNKAKGILVFIDDDKDELELLKVAAETLGLSNEIKTFKNGDEGFQYLRKTKDPIFLILSDLNMPKTDGLELKRMIELTPELKTKAIPFFFHTSASTPAEVRAAYALGIQGYFQKSSTLDETISILENIVSLWTSVIHPKDL